MGKSRLEAFSDGVLAIILTIMVLELKVPHGADWAALRPLLPVLLSYVLSFIYIGIYWNNHHHVFQLVKRVNGPMMWANLHLLFWLSLIPFATGWMGENHFTALPTALYGVPLLMSAVAFSILHKTMVAKQGDALPQVEVIGDNFKENLSLVFYVLAIPPAFVSPILADVLYVPVAAMWFIPDRRIERVFAENTDAGAKEAGG